MAPEEAGLQAQEQVEGLTALWERATLAARNDSQIAERDLLEIMWSVQFRILNIGARDSMLKRLEDRLETVRNHRKLRYR